jgi:hypothetical protein
MHSKQDQKVLVVFRCSIYNIPICIRIHKDCQVHTSLNPPLMCGKLDVEVKVLYGRMAFQVINVFEHFLAFAMTCNVVVVHNMCVIQLDPRFKGL